MRSIIPTSAANSRSLMVAVVLGSALAAGGNRTATASDSTRPARMAAETGSDADLIRDITRYCQACWRNGRVPADRWDDCTQQVFARLLERVPLDRWSDLLRSADEDSADRKEFVRAIDTVKKRSQRTRRHSELSMDVRDNRSDRVGRIEEQRLAVRHAAAELLSSRQRQIIELTADGWAVQDIASRLNASPERVSDEKYKAIRKLRTRLAVSETA